MLMKTRILFLLSFVAFCCTTALAQIQIKGTIVSDKDSESMIGVAILEQGTNNGRISDLDGNFSIEVKNNNASLVVSYVGYKTQTIKVNGRSVINIRMEEDTKLIDEVVVIGYGVQKKSDLTGSVASVKAEELKGLSTTDAAAALQGKASGVQILNGSGKPGQGASIRVRGYSSNSSNIGPLLIVDGLQVSSIQYLDPSMIESMEVLKDAASAAIYGAEAGNGVILITTKSGKKGIGKVHFSSQFSVSSLAHRTKVLNAADYIQYEKEANSSFSDLLNKYYYNEASATVNGKLADTDWQDEVYETGHRQR